MISARLTIYLKDSAKAKVVEVASFQIDNGVLEYTTNDKRYGIPLANIVEYEVYEYRRF